jgi:hypothetical protein
MNEPAWIFCEGCGRPTNVHFDDRYCLSCVGRKPNTKRQRIFKRVRRVSVTVRRNTSGVSDDE